MNRHFPRLASLALVVATAMAVGGCDAIQNLLAQTKKDAAGGPGGGGSVSVPAKGQEITKDFWAGFNPDFKAGMKWAYAMTTTCTGDTDTCKYMPALDGEIVNEVTGVSGDTVTMKSSAKIGDTTGPPSTQTFSKSASMMDTATSSIKFKSEGEEAVKVPAGEFRAAKVSYTTTTSGATTTWYMWVVPKVGPVKIESSSMSGKATLTMKLELKEKTGF